MTAEISGKSAKWRSYYEAVSGNPARDTTLLALDKWHEENPSNVGYAIDLACGEGRDTAEFLRRGWRVLAVDSEPAALDWLTARDDLTAPAARPQTRSLETLCSPMEDAEWEAADIVNASFALPFVPRDRFPGLWDRITGSLRPGGFFAGQIFGPDDDWASDSLSIYDRAGVDRLFQGFSFERREEINRAGKDAHGNAKHWHMFHIVARKD